MGLMGFRVWSFRVSRNNRGSSKQWQSHFNGNPQGGWQWLAAVAEIAAAMEMVVVLIETVTKIGNNKHAHSFLALLRREYTARGLGAAMGKGICSFQNPSPCTPSNLLCSSSLTLGPRPYLKKGLPKTSQSHPENAKHYSKPNTG